MQLTFRLLPKKQAKLLFPVVMKDMTEALELKANLDGKKFRNHASGNSGKSCFCLNLAADCVVSHDTHGEVSSWLHFSGFETHTHTRTHTTHTHTGTD